MNADELKALQTPLKEQYRTQPDSAIVTLKAIRMPQPNKSKYFQNSLNDIVWSIRPWLEE